MARPLLPLLMLCMLVLAGCLGALRSPGAPAVDPVEERGSTAAAPRFLPPVTITREAPGAEPVLAVTPDGTLFVHGTGITEQGTGRASVWRSLDGGTTWTDVTPPFPTAREAPFDGFTTAGPDGSVYVANAAGLTLHLFASRDGGDSWLPLVPPPLPVPAHRMWLVAEEPSTLHVAVEAYLPNQGLYYLRSEDGGVTWDRAAPVDLTTYMGSNLAVDPASGDLYAIRIDDPAGDASFSLVASRDGGETWQRHPMFRAEGDFVTTWPSLTVDPAGILYFTWGEVRDGNARALYAFSEDGGATWSRPRPVGGASGAQVFPWAATRAQGEVAFAWYASDEAGDPADMDTRWWVDHVLLRGADEPVPERSWTRLTSEPVKEGAICAEGFVCPNDDRRLLDFLWVTAGPDGRSHVAFASAMWEKPTAFPMYSGELTAPSSQ